MMTKQGCSGGGGASRQAVIRMAGSRHLAVGHMVGMVGMVGIRRACLTTCVEQARLSVLAAIAHLESVETSHIICG